ncbi:MAG: methylamine utilization protein [Pseudomonas sp.]|nr:methylamine utilization protein [Pseudomonas sp. PIA16]MDE1168020.1 methylamine utilization protein [Pseudomonas sp.]
MLDQDGKPLRNAVLTLSGNGLKAPVAGKADMDQHDKQFAPHVLVVHTGTQVKFPNSDDIRHQVYSFSEPKRFELRLYQGTPSQPLLFDKPGVVVLGCNIHDTMLGYVYVTADPVFAVSDDKGRIHLADLAPGQYTATLWHPQSADLRTQPAGDIQVPAAGLKQSFKVTVQPATGEAMGDMDGMDMSEHSQSDFGNAFDQAAREPAK